MFNNDYLRFIEPFVSYLDIWNTLHFLLF